jgi:hypothetical protein
LPTPEIQQLRKIWWRSAVAGAGCNCFGYPCTISVPVPATTKSAKRFFSCVNFFFYDRLTLKTVATGLTEFKASLMEFKASLMEFKASLMEFKASLMEFKASPTEFKASPTEFKASLTEFKASLTEFKASSTEFKASLMEY